MKDMQLEEQKFDENIFIADIPSEFNPPIYSTHEIDKLIYYLYDFTSPKSCIPTIINLLQATAHFKYGITTDPYFVDMRKKSKTEAEIQDAFDEMNQELLTAILMLKKLDNKKDEKLLSSAIFYAQKSILTSIAELERIDDEVSKLCWMKSSLRTTLRDVVEGK